MPDAAQQLVFGPWTAGLVNSVDAHSVPNDGLTIAENVEIDRDGVATTRTKWNLLDSANYSSLFKHNGVTYAVRNGELGFISDTSFEAITNVNGPVCWTILDDKPVYSDRIDIKMLEEQAVIDLPSGYYEGDEEEEYVYQTLPGGSEIHHWRGRLLVVRGNSLLWSEPLRYSVYSALRNYIKFPERIFWVVPLDSGIYVGLRNSVVFLVGPVPEKFVIREVGKKSAFGVSSKLDRRFTGDAGQDFALWFTDVGIAVGDQSGKVTYPQADRLKDLPLLPGKMVVEDDRVYIFTTMEH